MDTSKEYILMCAKAVRLQFYFKDLKNNAWDWATYLELNPIPKPCISNAEYVEHIDKIVLFRQDQLQGMIVDKYRESQKNNLAYHHLGDGYLATVMFEDILQWADMSKKMWVGGKTQWWKSMEQLWLAFVMNEKHSKQWNGKDWITNES